MGAAGLRKKILLLAVGAALIPGVAYASPQPLDDPLNLSESAAMKIARRDKKNVEVTSLTSDRRRVVADPTTATFTETLSAFPVRAKRGDVWAGIDQTLVRGSGRLAPKVGLLDVSVADGGLGDLAKVSDGGQSFSLRWPEALPTPTLRGNKAVYLGVRPGIDLVVEVGSTGFSESLVVESREAAKDPLLKSLTFATSTPGLGLRKVGQTVEAAGADGAAVFASEPIQMWGTTGSVPATAADAAAFAVDQSVAAKRADVDFDVVGGNVLLRPSQAFLNDPTVTYPVVIDPAIYSANRVHYAKVTNDNSDNHFDSPDDNVSPQLGYYPRDNKVIIYRLYYSFDVSALAGKSISSATFRHRQVYANHGSDAACRGDSTANPDINLHRSKDFTKRFSWADRPDELSYVTHSDKVGGNAKDCKNYSGIDQDWNVSGAVQDELADTKNGNTVFSLYLNVQGDNDKDPNTRSNSEIEDGYRVYTHQNGVNRYPQLVVTYNTDPLAPTDLAASPYHTTRGATFVSSTSPTLSAVVRDVDPATQQVYATFYVRSDATTQPPAPGVVYRVYSNTVTDPGTTGIRVSAALPTPLENGRNYWMDASATDGSGTGIQPTSLNFTVDTTAPNTPTVTGPASIKPGSSGTFTIASSSSDVDYYQWGLDTSAPGTTLTPTNLGGTSTVTVAVAASEFPRRRTFNVQSFDRAGNPSGVLSFAYNVG